MNLRDLRYLVALADHRHFGRAAAASFVGQPTLSMQLKKLEDELGVALVERSSRKVMLTAIGREIAERARGLLRDADAIRELARASRDPEAGQLRIGLFPTLAPYLLPHVMPKLRERFPRLELLLVEEKTEVVHEQLAEGRLDAGIMALPLADEQLSSELLFEEAFVLAVPRQHRLGGQQSLALADIADESLLLLDEGHCLRDQALDVCHRAGASERSGFRATSLETLRQMVGAGVGATLLPLLAVQPPVPLTPDIHLLPFRGTAPHRRIGFFWRKHAANAGFLKQIAAVFREVPKELLSTGSLRDPVQGKPGRRARATAGLGKS